MITVRRAADRRHERRPKHEAWFTFAPADGAFGALEQVDEDRLAPGAGAGRRSDRDREILTYVHEGAVSHEDSMGRSVVIQAGEFERMTAGTGIRHSETNASRTNVAHVFHLRIRSSAVGIEPSHEQRRFSAADRRGSLCVIASPDGRASSLHIHQDAVMYSTMLDRGQHVVHALAEGRSAWLHVVRGEVMLDDNTLCTGDGAGLTAERAVSITAHESTELLLLDLGPPSRTLAE